MSGGRPNAIDQELHLAVRTADVDHHPLADGPSSGLPAPDRATVEHALRAMQRRIADRPHLLCTVLLVNLDNFSAVNDSFGHAAGDRVLFEVSRRIHAAVGAGHDRHAVAVMEDDDATGAPAVLHLGGDEFVVLLDDLSSIDDAPVAADHIRRHLLAPVHVGPDTVVLRCSIGIAVCPARDARGADLLRDSATAMRRAKASGRGGNAVFRERMRIDAIRRLRLEADLALAVATGQVEAVYQPIVALESGRVVSFEALARWHHPVFGAVSPEEFIPIAEETGLVVPLAHTLLCRAIDLLERLNTLPGGERIRMNVNVSRRQLSDASFLPTVQSLVNELSVAPARLCLEITESMVMSAPGGIRDSLLALKALGVQLHIDDFGTGLSSLSLLRTLPLDGIKVDRSFIEAAEDREAIAILHAIITLGRNLRKVTTAEGLETTTHMATVLALECDLAQGFLLGRPVGAEGAAVLLTQDFSSRVAMGDSGDGAFDTVR